MIAKAASGVVSYYLSDRLSTRLVLDRVGLRWLGRRTYRLERPLRTERHSGEASLHNL